MNAMTNAPEDPITETDGDATVASATPRRAARRSGLSRLSNKERLVLLAALAVVVVGTTAAALSPDRSGASVVSLPAKVTTATANACPATVSAEVTPLASLPATAAGVATTGSTSATASAAATTTRRTVARAAATKAVAAAPALVTIGTLVNFGSYGNAPLQWRVLYADDDELILLSRYVLSAGAFQSDWEGKDASRYGASEVRTWLQGDFAAAAFTTQQSAALLPHTGGSVGSDRVFLLSAAEVTRYLPKTAKRKAAPHAVAGAGHIGYSGEALSLSGAYASWWLADAASDDFAARLVGPSGEFGSELVYCADIGVRPAIRVNRDKIAFTLDAPGGD